MRKVNVWHRLCASLFDLFLLLVNAAIVCIPAIITLLYAKDGGNDKDYLALFIASLGGGMLILAVAVTYLIFLPVYMNGQTLGKKIFKLKIIKNDGSNVSFTRLFIREVVRLFLMVITVGMSSIANIFVIIFSKKHQSFQDIMCSCQVIDIE